MFTPSRGSHKEEGFPDKNASNATFCLDLKAFFSFIVFLADWVVDFRNSPRNDIFGGTFCSML